MQTGVIIKGIGGKYFVKSGDGVLQCSARGKLRNQNILPMVGDRVDVLISGKTCSIENIHPRETMLIRPAVANINQLVIVIALTAPQPDVALIDNFLLLGEVKGLDIILCLNKTDLSDAGELREIYQQAGYKVVCTTCVQGAECKVHTGCKVQSAECKEVQENGLDELRSLLKDKITAFAGNSGVGKSSILNAIGLGVKLATGEVSKKIERGKHTTRHVELLQLPDGGFVLDTPGFSTFELPNIKAQQLEQYFPEFRKFLDQCRFRGCAHINEPDCAVRAGLERGEISPKRHESYVHIYNELKKIKEWEV